MPSRAKGVRLYLKPAHGSRAAAWIIRDGPKRISTGFCAGEVREAEGRLAEYIVERHTPASVRNGAPETTPIADVLDLYAEAATGRVASPSELEQRVEALLDFFGTKTLAEVNSRSCASYVASRGSVSMARRELEDLRAAINFHRKEGLCNAIVNVTLPQKGASRERWITRSEAARLLRAAWRYREVQKGKPTGRYSRRHVARFILVGLYTGTRAGAICGASFSQVGGRGHIDLASGVYRRRPHDAVETKKRQPTIRIPLRLLAHMRRWHANGAQGPVEFNGRSIGRMAKAFARTATDCGMPDVTPHILRHSAITWAMENGADLWKASGYFGVSVKVLEEVYGHHRPGSGLY